jgi:hypothetical protein
LGLLLNLSARFELPALADEILLFAPIVLSKHRWVTLGEFQPVCTYAYAGDSHHRGGFSLAASLATVAYAESKLLRLFRITSSAA